MNQPRHRLTVALAQIDPTVGDIAGNARLIAAGSIAPARRVPVLSSCPSYAYPGTRPRTSISSTTSPRPTSRRSRRSPPGRRDHGPGRLRRARARGRRAPRRRAAGRALCTTRSPRFATARIEAVYRKNRLPNYGVFDEVRYFEPGSGPALIEVDGVRVGLTICEDLWEPGPPGALEAEAGAELIVNAVRLAVPARQGSRPRGDVRRARPRLRRADRLLQPRRRPGRARLRRAQLRRRRGRRRRRPRPPVRPRTCSSGSSAARARRASKSRSATSTRSTPRSCSGFATTPARTASGRSSSGSRAGSTRPWWR